MHKEFFLIFFFFLKIFPALNIVIEGKFLSKCEIVAHIVTDLLDLFLSLSTQIWVKKKRKNFCYFSLILSTFYFPFSFLNIPIFLSAQPNGYFVLDCENFMLVNFLKF